MATVRSAKIDFSANDVWAAACKAQRINGDYIKVEVLYDKKIKTNRQLMLRFLEDPKNRLTIRDRNEGVKIQQYFKGYMFKKLSGERMSEFDQAAYEVADVEKVTTSFQFGVIASLPSVYAKAIVRDEQNRKLRSLRSNKLIGKAGDKVELDFEVIRSVYSHKWAVYYTTGTTPTGEVVYFASAKLNPKPGSLLKIKGTVKQHRMNDAEGNQTQLNRVKIITDTSKES
jgi:hypothetical protein